MTLKISLDISDVHTLLSGNIIKKGDVSIYTEEISLDEMVTELKKIQLRNATSDNRVFHLVSQSRSMEVSCPKVPHKVRPLLSTR